LRLKAYKESKLALKMREDMEEIAQRWIATQGKESMFIGGGVVSGDYVAVLKNQGYLRFSSGERNYQVVGTLDGRTINRTEQL
jgi:hypothetical protein